MRQIYDYIIVGGGSAGSILASRLSSRSDNQVLLCEADEDTPDGRVSEAILDSRSGFASRVTTEATTHNASDAARPRLVRYAQARLLGGGSSINGQLVSRGAPHDYDEWERCGTSGRRWDTVLPISKRSSVHRFRWTAARQRRPHSGPLHVPGALVGLRESRCRSVQAPREPMQFPLAWRTMY